MVPPIFALLILVFTFSIETTLARDKRQLLPKWDDVDLVIGTNPKETDINDSSIVKLEKGQSSASNKFQAPTNEIQDSAKNWEYSTEKDEMSGKVSYIATNLHSKFYNLKLVILQKGGKFSILITGRHFYKDMSEMRVKVDEKLLTLKVTVGRDDYLTGICLFTYADSSRLINLFRNGKAFKVEMRLGNDGFIHIVDFDIRGLANDIKNPSNK